MRDDISLRMAVARWIMDSYTAGHALPPNAYIPASLGENERRDLSRAMIAVWVSLHRPVTRPLLPPARRPGRFGPLTPKRRSLR